MKNNHRVPTDTPALREQWIDVTVDVDVDRQVVRLIEPLGEVQEYTSRDIRALADSAMRNRGQAQWCAKYSQLLIPGVPRGTHGGPFHKLTPARVTLPA